MDPYGDLPTDPDTADNRGVKAPGAREILRGNLDIVAAIALGGAIGGGARWLLGQALPHDPGRFPWSTFVENVTGCLLLGALLVLVTEVWAPSRYVRPFLGVGVLGGYTTFSTYAAEIHELMRAGNGPLALAYLFGTVAAGLMAAWLGMTLVRILIVRPTT
jgi:CrcB protein